jgi:crotonobetainyl-CoA:carnitine CoA-transferase CaiB-like acyl-CoA transferase
MSDAAPRRGPLDGIRVLDLSRVLAGPFCSMILADLGAEVIKVEDIDGGDQTRTVPPFRNGESHYFVAINRNKQSVALDARTPEGRDLVLALAAECDVVLENFRPGVMDRLGLSYATLQSRNPAVILCSISGFGATGAMRDKPSFDLVTQGLSGVMSINGFPDAPPTKLGLPMGDIAGGMWAAIAVLAAVNDRHVTGKGAQIDLSLLEGLMGLLGYLAQMHTFTGENPGRMGNSHHNIVPYGVMPTQDGHVVLALHVGAFWRKFCETIERTDLLDDPRFRGMKDRFENRDALEAIIAGITRQRTTAEWQSILDAGDVPSGPVNDIGQALSQPIVEERGFVKTIEHPVAGMLKVLASPLRFPDRYPDLPLQPSPLLGADTEAVLREWCGVDAAGIARLIAAGVVARAPASSGSSV